METEEMKEEIKEEMNEEVKEEIKEEVKEEPKEWRIKEEEEPQPLCVPESSAVWVKSEDQPEQIQTELKKETPDRETDISADTENTALNIKPETNGDQNPEEKPLPAPSEHRAYSCHVCHRTFTQKSNLKTHLKVHTGEKPFSCSLCHKEFSQKGTLKAHLKTHSRTTLSCSLCSKTFAHEGYLQQHMRNHTGRKSYCCSLCDRTFAQYNYLESHLRTHTQRRTYTCSICNKSLSSNVILGNHMRMHRGEKPFSCMFCEKSFGDKNTLKGHVRTHTGDKPYTCPLCQKTFALYRALDSHLKTHSGDKPHRCSSCHRAFGQKGAPDRQDKKHRGEKPFGCSVCTKDRGVVKYTKLDDTTPVLQVFLDPEQDMKPDYRLTRESVNGLMRLLKREQDHGWGYELEILIFVYWLAHGVSYRVAASAFSVPKSTVCRVVHRIAQAIMENAHEIIAYPKQEELEDVGKGFGRLARNKAFDKAVGAVDVCHIRIKPPGQNKERYFNSRHFYSIQMQAICDSTGRFLNIFLGSPGSVHDSQVLRNSPVYVNAEYPPPGFFILGDGGYPCLRSPIAVITPYEPPLQGQAEAEFNACLSRSRSVIERAFGTMRTRWPKTMCKALEVRIEFCTQVVTACAFLHNVSLSYGDVLEPEEAEEQFSPPPPNPGEPEQEESGDRLRDRLSAQVSEGSLSEQDDL